MEVGLSYEQITACFVFLEDGGDLATAESATEKTNKELT